MLRLKILLACCALLTVGAIGAIVAPAARPNAVAQDYPTPTTAATPTTAPSPRTGRTTVTSPFAAIDSAYAALGKAIEDYKAGHTGPTPTPTPSPTPSPTPPPPGTAAFVRWVNWWCADGMRDGQRVLHHLEEFGANSPEVAAYAKLVKLTTGPRFSWDTSSLGNDAKLTEQQRISSHKALFGVDNIQHVRVFFGTSVPRWNDPRILALTDKDSMVISSLSTDRAGIAAFLAATPAKFRTRPHQVTYAFGHEREANLDVGPKLKAWLAGNQMIADLLNAAPGYSSDDLVKITLWYSQEKDKRVGVTIPSREQMYGGQNFGTFGEDVYNPRAANRYYTPQEMFGPITAFCKKIGRPCAIPEWGGERIPSDTTGAGRAKFITDGAAYLTTLG